MVTLDLRCCVKGQSKELLMDLILIQENPISPIHLFGQTLDTFAARKPALNRKNNITRIKVEWCQQKL